MFGRFNPAFTFNVNKYGSHISKFANGFAFSFVQSKMFPNPALLIHCNENKMMLHSLKGVKHVTEYSNAKYTFDLKKFTIYSRIRKFVSAQVNNSLNNFRFTHFIVRKQEITLIVTVYMYLPK